MKLGFWFGGLSATVFAAQVVGCLGSPFVTTGGTGGTGGGASSTSSGTGGGVSASTATSSTTASTGTGGVCPGMTDCSGTCADLQTDKLNCGTCKNKCGPKSECTGGQCACATAGDIYCGVGVGCVDPITPQHCGGCNACPLPNDTCASGQCLCAGGGVDCGGTCPDISTDPLNCGGCGHQCSASEVCFNSKCKCRTGFTQCPPMGSTFACVDTQHDASHCGVCTTACSGGGNDKCSAGVCTHDCPGGTQLCGDGGCYTQAQLDSDPVNCGTCDHKCQPNEACVGGTCGQYFVPGSCVTCPCAACTNAPGYTCCTVSAGPLNVPVCYQGSACPGG
jgi:hypothetical protein